MCLRLHMLISGRGEEWEVEGSDMARGMALNLSDPLYVSLKFRNLAYC